MKVQVLLHLIHLAHNFADLTLPAIGSFESVREGGVVHHRLPDLACVGEDERSEMC